MEPPPLDPESERDFRRVRYAQRFQVLGAHWMTTLRHCSWRGSLTHAFEEPSMHLPGLSDQGYTIGRRQFTMALNYAMVRPTACSEERWGALLRELFDLFDVTGRGVDWREVCLALLFFKQPLDTEPENTVLSWWRAYSGDVRGGLDSPEFLAMLCALCVTAEEAHRVTSCVNIPVLLAYSRFRPTGAVATASAADSEHALMGLLGQASVRRGSMVWQRFHSNSAQTTTTTTMGGRAEDTAVALRAAAAVRFGERSSERGGNDMERETRQPPTLLSQAEFTDRRHRQQQQRQRLLIDGEGGRGDDAGTPTGTTTLPLDSVEGEGYLPPWGASERPPQDMDADAQLLTSAALKAVRSAAMNPSAAPRGSPGRIDAACIHLLFRISPQLAGVLSRLAQARTHPLLRAEYQRQLLTMAALRVGNNLAMTREVAGEARAVQFHLRATASNAFRQWAAWVQGRVFRAALVRSFAARR